LANPSGLWVPLFYAIALLVISPTHKYFIEWGGVMQYFAGKEIVTGLGYHGWTSHFWPPLFSILIGLFSTVFSGFVAGKLISIVAGSILLYVAYDLANTLSDKKNTGLLVQLFIIVCPLYFLQSLLAHNHMLDSLLFIMGLWMIWFHIED
jgi:hypothetical protein